MGRGIFPAQGGIGAARDDRSVARQQRSHGNFTASTCPAGEAQRLSHEGLITLLILHVISLTGHEMVVYDRA
jgi:hypothetical protein